MAFVRSPGRSGLRPIAFARSTKQLRTVPQVPGGLFVGGTEKSWRSRGTTGAPGNGSSAQTILRPGQTETAPTGFVGAWPPSSVVTGLV